MKTKTKKVPLEPPATASLMHSEERYCGEPNDGAGASRQSDQALIERLKQAYREAEEVCK